MSAPRLQWPTKLLGSPPTSREIDTACTLVLVTVLVGVCVVLVNGQGFSLDYDFIGFYSPGRLLNEYPANRLYDFALQEKVFLELWPSERFLTLPYVHAPFEALLFAAYARLPVRIAYLAWLASGAVAYTGALYFLLRRFGPRDARTRKTVWLVSWSFTPFVLDSWVGGNVAVIAFVALSAAVLLDDVGCPLLSGFALSFCLNKPSLLILVLPMLLVTRRVRVLVGFACGAATMVLASSLVLGWEVWWRFVETLLVWAHKTRSAPGLFKDWKYVDLNAFFRMLPGGRTSVGILVMAGFALWTGVRLVRAWTPRTGDRDAVRRLGWASAITWSLVLNAYVPIYDCTLLVLAGFVAAAALRDPTTDSIPSSLTSVVVLCYVVAWATQPIARASGVQVYTLVLIYCGEWLLSQVRRLRNAPIVADAVWPACS